jgi:hypothetical protein
MNINGLPSHLANLRGVQDASRARVDQERAAHLPATPASRPAGAVRDPLAVGTTQPALPAEAPAGTDPELWSVLSAEERVFFAKVGAMGPLTYGRVSAEMRAESSIPRGGRLDVKA